MSEQAMANAEGLAQWAALLAPVIGSLVLLGVFIVAASIISVALENQDAD